MKYLVILFLFVSCKTQLVHVPVETVKTEKEYVDRLLRDSIYIKDSVIINMKSDTVFIEKYKYLYRDRFIKDSVFITDSVRIEIPYPVEVVKEINRLRNWQIILIVLGGSAIGFLGFNILRKIKKLF